MHTHCLEHSRVRLRQKAQASLGDDPPDLEAVASVISDALGCEAIHGRSDESVDRTDNCSENGVGRPMEASSEWQMEQHLSIGQTDREQEQYLSIWEYMQRSANCTKNGARLSIVFIAEHLKVSKRGRRLASSLILSVLGYTTTTVRKTTCR